MVGDFPIQPAVIRLVGALTSERHDEWQVDPKSVSAQSLASLKPEDGAPLAAAANQPPPGTGPRWRLGSRELPTHLTGHLCRMARTEGTNMDASREQPMHLPTRSSID